MGIQLSLIASMALAQRSSLSGTGNPATIKEDGCSKRTQRRENPGSRLACTWMPHALFDSLHGPALLAVRHAWHVWHVMSDTWHM
eukprot:1156248-Pelagomonas_calceolata.AAC.9